MRFEVHLRQYRSTQKLESYSPLQVHMCHGQVSRSERPHDTQRGSGGWLSFRGIYMIRTTHWKESHFWWGDHALFILCNWTVYGFEINRTSEINQKEFRKTTQIKHFQDLPLGLRRNFTNLNHPSSAEAMLVKPWLLPV